MCSSQARNRHEFCSRLKNLIQLKAQQVKNLPGSIPDAGRSPWKRAWQPSPVFLSGESHGQRSLAGYSPQGRKESGMTEHGAKTDRPSFKDEHSCDPKVLVEAPQVCFCSSGFSCNSENACEMPREVYQGKINSTKTISSRKRFNSLKGVFQICPQRFLYILHLCAQDSPKSKMQNCESNGPEPPCENRRELLFLDR